jgi:hypothetical protein
MKFVIESFEVFDCASDALVIVSFRLYSNTNTLTTEHRLMYKFTG